MAKEGAAQTAVVLVLRNVQSIAEIVRGDQLRVQRVLCVTEHVKQQCAVYVAHAMAVVQYKK